MRRDLSLEMVYPNPPEEVWRALTDSDALARWFMANDFAPRIGHKFHFHSTSRFGLGRTIPCEVLEVVDRRLLSYSWGGDGSVVTFRLESVAAGGTRLSLQHTGLRGLRGVAMAWVLGHGWAHKIEQRLPAVLAQTGSIQVRGGATR